VLLNAELNHDLAIALIRADIEDDPAKRQRDLGRMRSVFVAELKPIQDLLAQQMLLRNFPASDQFIQVLRCSENACNGPWSEWIAAGLTDSVSPLPG